MKQPINCLGMRITGAGVCTSVWILLAAIVFILHGEVMPAAAQTSGSSSQTVTSQTLAPAGSTFIFYDDTDETNSALLNYTGAQKAAVVYGNGNAGGASIQCNASTCITYTQAQFNQLVENAVEYYGTSAVILFDFENILIGDATSTQNAMLRLAAQKQYLAWTRALYPNALISTYDQDNLNSYISVRQQIYANGGGTSYDFYAPQEYQGSSSTAQDIASGIINAMSASGAVNPNLPFIPFISPYPYSSTVWSTLLSDLYACTVPTSSACQALGASASTAYAKVGGAILYDGVRPTGPQLTISTSPLEAWVQTLDQYQPPALSAGTKYQVAGASGSCVGAAGSGSIATGTCSSQSTAQAWTFTIRTVCNSVDATKTYYAANSVQTDISNGCTPTTSTSETIFDTSAGFYSIGGSGGVWDVNSSGSLVLTSGSQTTFSQLWQPAWLANGYYQIVNVGSQYATGGSGNYEQCLQIGSSGQLSLAKCNQSASQSFSLSSVTTTTTLSVAASPNPVTAGQNVTYTATLTPSNTSAGTPTGTVQFYSNGTAVNGPVSISNNTATMTVASSTAGGTFSITAVYSGDANYKSSTSPATSLTVTGGSTEVNDSSSAITYSGTWNYSSGRGFGDYNNDVHYTNTNGASASYTFTGKSIAFITEKYSDEGNVAVYIDGTLVTTVSASNSTRQAQQTLYTKTWTTSGSHTIKVVKTSGTNMLVDAFKVSN